MAGFHGNKAHDPDPCRFCSLTWDDSWGNWNVGMSGQGTVGVEGMGSLDWVTEGGDIMADYKYGRSEVWCEYDRGKYLVRV